MNAIPANSNFSGADEIALDTDGAVAPDDTVAPIAPLPEIAASCMVERAPFAAALAVGRVAAAAPPWRVARNSIVDGLRAVA